jgi:hypothetical protein
LTVLGETIHASDESLHVKLCERLERDIKSYVPSFACRPCRGD